MRWTVISEEAENIMHGYVDIDKNDLFIVDCECDRVTRGHDLKI